MTANNDNQPFDMIVVGASGDLAHRKLLPSLYYLHKDGHLPPGRIVGVARPSISREEYLAAVEASCRRHVAEGDFNLEDWASFAERVDYACVSATDPDTYSDLVRVLGEEPDRTGVLYLATPPRIYGAVSKAYAAAGLVSPASRIVLEKPIGRDLESAAAINSAVGEVFDEHQIYRIDHYLGKETVQNLTAVRFGNALFEPLWRAEHVDHVQITVAESLGVGSRGGYYDHAGALRDMVQNHLLQLLCLVAMEPPARLEQDSIRDEKIKVLRSLRPIGAADVGAKTVRGQYRQGAIAGQAVRGYLEEDGVPGDSKTETFVALQAEIDNWRWAGVPFFLRTGKRLGHRVSEVVIKFRQVPHMLFPDSPGNIDDNRLVIRLQPDESIKLSMMVKVPGPDMRLETTHLSLNMGESGRMPQAYERLLLDVILGNATLFIHRHEVEEAWRWIEPILAAWAKRPERPRPYVAGSWGPTDSAMLLSKAGSAWYEEIVETLRG